MQYIAYSACSHEGVTRRHPEWNQAGVSCMHNAGLCGDSLGWTLSTKALLAMSSVSRRRDQASSSSQCFASWEQGFAHTCHIKMLSVLSGHEDYLNGVYHPFIALQSLCR